MDISNRGLDLIKTFEGLELEAYQDIVGIWTIGYGHTSMAGPPEVVPGMEVTEEEATEILLRDLGQYMRGVERAVKVNITQNMFDALVSLTFNIGVNGMKNSTFIRRLNEGDYEGCAEAMLWWNKAGGRVVAGLKRRREAEAALFLEGYDPGLSDDIADDPRGVPVEENSPRRENLGESRTVGGATTAGAAGAVGAGTALLTDDDEGSEEETETGGETPADEPSGETTDAPTDPAPEPEDTTPGTEQPSDDVFVTAFKRDEAWDAVIIAAGVIAVIAAIYVILVRIDDWRNHKR